MKIVALTASREEAIYTVELEPGLYVDVKSCRTSPYLIYVMQNEDGTVLYEDDGNDRHAYSGTYFYNEEVEQTIINLIALKEQGFRIPEVVPPRTACPFCRELEDMKAREEAWKESPRYKPGCTEEYTAACVTTSYCEGNFAGRITSRGFALNYCPTCGKSLMPHEDDAPTDKPDTADAECASGSLTDIEDLKNMYDCVAPERDPHGFKLFRAAQNILGKFEYSHFAYEDNMGCFEEADGHKMLAYLLVQYDYKLGQHDHRNRWVQVHPCYEKCIDLTIDRSTPEYIMFEKELYAEVLDLLGVAN